jgi:hypothetical protein
VSTPSTSLPVPVAAALDDIETATPVGTVTIDPSRHDQLSTAVARELHIRVTDPIDRALLSREKIFAWALHQATEETETETPAPRSALYRKAPPFVEEPGPAGDSSPALAVRVRDVIRTVAPDFLQALVTHTNTAQKLKITAAEKDAVIDALPSAARGHPATELDLVVGQALAEHRAARAHDTIMSTFGDRASGSTGTPASPTWSAVPITDAPPDQPRTCEDPCEVGTIPLAAIQVGDPAALISTEHLTAAAVLAGIHQYGDRIGFFRAVDEAIRQLDSDEWCIEEPRLLNALHCWTERDNRITAAQRATLAATVFGIDDADRPGDVRPDPHMPALLDRLLDALNANCNPGACSQNPGPADSQRLRTAVRAVQIRMSSAMTARSVMRVRELQVQFGKAQKILQDLARFVRAPCPQPGPATGTDEWISIRALLGPTLPDGTDLVEAAETARACQILFAWLASPDVTAEGELDELCLAAARLRPAKTSDCDHLRG